LHDNARKALANYLIGIVTGSDDPPRFVLETHSRTFLLAVQLAIARWSPTPGPAGQARISPDLVRVYWMDPQPDGSVIPLPVDFDSDGRPTTSILREVLDDDERLISELLEIQLAGGG